MRDYKSMTVDNVVSSMSKFDQCIDKEFDVISKIAKELNVNIKQEGVSNRWWCFVLITNTDTGRFIQASPSILDDEEGIRDVFGKLSIAIQ